MESLNVPKTLSFASNDCEVRTGLWEPHIPAAEADDVIVPCSSDSVNHVSCKNPQRDEFIEDVGGLAFTTNLQGNENLELPRFIPVLQKSFLWTDPATIPCDTVGVSLADIFTTAMTTSGGRLQAPARYKLNPRVFASPVFQNKKVILIMSGRDLLIENLWMQQDELDLFESLGKADFHAVTSPNFSVFTGECPLGQRINQKKSLECARLLEGAGAIAIPHMYAMTESHVQAYIKYLQEHPKVRMIIMNCTLQRKVPGEVDQIRKVVWRLIGEVGNDLHIIFQGLNVKDAAQFCEHGANVHYAVSTPFHHALVHTEDVFDSDMRAIVGIGRSSLSKEELVATNVQAYSDFVNNVCEIPRD